MSAKGFKPLLKKINALRRLDQAKRRVGLSMLTITSERIFTDGKSSDGQKIGDYSDSYMKVRERKKWPDSTKVILQAGRQMVLDFSLVLEGDKWGLGFKNSDNQNKSEWVEITFEKSIFAHTDSEVTEFTNIMQNEVNRVLAGN